METKRGATMNENFYEMVPKEDPYKVKKSPPVQRIGSRKRELQKVETKSHTADEPKSFSQLLSEAVENLERESQKDKPPPLAGSRPL